MRYFNLCPESLDAKTVQFASLLGRGWERVDWEGRGGLFCGISIIFIYIFMLFTYLHFYSVSVAVLWFFILLFFVMGSVSTNTFLCFFCVWFCDIYATSCDHLERKSISLEIIMRVAYEQNIAESARRRKECSG